jgi:hypothetical protein
VGALGGLVAHGGTGGLVAEIVVAVGVGAVAIAAWVHARKGR